MAATEKQIGGDHYKRLAIQPGVYSYRNNLNAWAHDIIRRITRAGVVGAEPKGGIEGLKDDLRKTIHTCELWLECLEGNKVSDTKPSDPAVESVVLDLPPSDNYEWMYLDGWWRKAKP